MAWTNPQVKFSVLRGTTTSNLHVTSTATVPFDARLATDPLLRMFFNPSAADALDPTVRIPVNPGEVIAAGLEPLDSDSAYLPYLDSDSDGNFSLDAAGFNILPQTWIPHLRDFDDWDLSWPDYVTTAVTLNTSGRATYDDPSVVAVPDALGGGYLMVLLRKREFTSTINGRSPAPTPPSLPAGVDLPPPDTIANSYVTDIVAYWSDSLDFSGTSATILGPILLVDSLNALPDAPFRVFVGVPSAAFAIDPESNDWRLYVYYAVEFPKPPYLLRERTPAYSNLVGGSPYALFYSRDQGFIACKRFKWTSIQGNLLYHPAERAWGSATRGGWPLTWPVAGDLLGRVRLWVPKPLTGFLYRAEEMLSLYSATLQRCTDPEAEATSAQDGSAGGDLGDARVRAGDQAVPPRVVGLLGEPSLGDLTLYFRGKNSGALSGWQDGHGLWRASAIDHNVTLQVTDAGVTWGFRTTVFGVDFAVAAQSTATTPSRDLVVSAGMNTFDASFPDQDPADPDPVRVEVGALVQWWVFGGFFSLESGSSTDLGLVVGDYSDGVRPWRFAWYF